MTRRAGVGSGSEVPSDRSTKAAVPRLALSIAESCEALGVSWDYWREHVAPHIPIVRKGTRKLVPVSALEAWLERNALAVDARQPSACGPAPMARSSRALGAGPAASTTGRGRQYGVGDGAGRSGDPKLRAAAAAKEPRDLPQAQPRG